MQSPPQGDLASASLPGEQQAWYVLAQGILQHFSAAHVSPKGLPPEAWVQWRHGADPAFQTHICTAASWADSQHQTSGKPIVSSTARACPLAWEKSKWSSCAGSQPHWANFRFGLRSGRTAPDHVGSVGAGARLLMLAKVCIYCMQPGYVRTFMHVLL